MEERSKKNPCRARYVRAPPQSPVSCVRCQKSPMSVPGLPKTDPLFEYGRSAGAPFTREASFVGIRLQRSVADPGLLACADCVPDARHTAEPRASTLSRASP